jgi:hypothetical protein
MTDRPRPALPTLQADQRALIDPDRGDDVGYGLRGGFPDRQAVINWYQRAVVRTFGHITDTWTPVDLLRDRTLLRALIPDDERDGVGESTAYHYRLSLEKSVVLPACNRAYNDLRKQAGEYVEDEHEDKLRNVDPESQEAVAMRPAFQVADAQQSDTLRELWGGFETIETLQSWLHDLNEPTNGALDDTLPTALGRDPAASKHLLTGRVDEQDARLYRERFAIRILLPAFAEGIERMEVGERAQQTGGDLTATHG